MGLVFCCGQPLSAQQHKTGLEEIIMRMLFLLIIVGISSAAMADLKSDEVAYYQNLADSPTIVSIQDGDWGDTAAWDPGRTPGYGDRVLVAHQVRLNGIHTDPVATIDITGEIYTNRKQKIELHFDTMLVNETGTLRMGDGNKGITQKQRLVVHDIDGGA